MTESVGIWGILFWDAPPGATGKNEFRLRSVGGRRRVVLLGQDDFTLKSP
ncbi:MAG: hypothetical protein LBC94_08705 [Desulfovibrio sp.]|nr:hypothetical protein [Desulfovibrio sp.]